MKNILTTALLCLVVGGFASAQSLDTVRIQMTGMDGSVPISSDDAEQINQEIDKLYDDDLDMGWEGDEFNIVSTGLRFAGVNVPFGATIDSAFIEIWSHEDEGDPAIITIFGENSDNAVTYNETDLITDRPRTADSVVWNCTEEWTIWTKYRTPELKTLVQEIVNRQNWSAGNAMAFLLMGQDQGASLEDNARDFESFENVEDPDDGGDGLNHPERIPKLFIYYSPTQASDLEQVNNLILSSNPVVDGLVKLDMNQFLGEEDVNITLSSINGAELNRWEMPILSNAVLPLEINTPAGTYILKVQSTKKIGTVKLVVL
jgi:hypothetical protein